MGKVYDLDEYREKKKRQDIDKQKMNSKTKKTLFQEILMAVHGMWMTPDQAKDLHDFLMKKFYLQFEDMSADDKIVLSEHARKRQEEEAGVIEKGDSIKAAMLIDEIKFIVDRGFFYAFTPQQTLITVRHLRAIYGIQ